MRPSGAPTARSSRSECEGRASPQEADDEALLPPPKGPRARSFLEAPRTPSAHGPDDGREDVGQRDRRGDCGARPKTLYLRRRSGGARFIARDRGRCDFRGTPRSAPGQARGSSNSAPQRGHRNDVRKALALSRDPRSWLKPRPQARARRRPVHSPQAMGSAVRPRQLV